MVIFFPINASSAARTPGVEMTGQDICTAILQEIGVVGAVDPPAPEDSTFVLSKVNRLLDLWNADQRKRFTFETFFEPYTLTPNQAIHTIGPTGDFVVVGRPQKIDGATLLLTGTSPTIRIALNIRSKDWYREQSEVESTIDIPSDLYYEPTYPNGSIHLLPIGSAAYELELMTRDLLSAITLTDQVVLPPGYREAIVLTGAERCVAPMRVSMPDGLPRAAREARDIIIDANTDGPPALSTRDSGMGPDDSGGSCFDYRTRSTR